MIWAILAGSIVALPVGVLRRFRWAAILTGLVLLECIVLAINGGRCPLSDLAAPVHREPRRQLRHLPAELASPIQRSHSWSALHRWRIGRAGILAQGEVCETSRQFHLKRRIQFRIILLHVLRPVLTARKVNSESGRVPISRLIVPAFAWQEDGQL